MKFFLLISMILTAQFICGQRPEPTLKLGDPAPPVVVEKWVKGHPIDIHDGKVHVIEFWATWCGPCKFGMPHVSNLAKKYKGTVEVAGISVWEHDDDYLPGVERFVAYANESMDYNVAAGGGENAVMGDTYVKAAGANGIPYAFVIDRQGRIAWHGHPLIGLDEAVKLAVEDKLTVVEAENLNKRLAAMSEKGQELRATFLSARRSGDHKTVLSLADSIVNNYPHMGGMVIPYQYIAYANTDPEAAKRFGKKLLTEYYNAPMILLPTATKILDEKTVIMGERDYDLALKLIQQTLKMQEAGVSHKALMAKAYYMVGDKENAVRVQEEVVVLAKENLEAVKKSMGESDLSADDNSEVLHQAQELLESTLKTLAYR